MSILIDYNQVFLSAIFSQGKNNINEDLVRHTVLSCTLSYKRHFGKEFGDLIFCADGIGNCWRKEVYPYYKANRKKNRESSGIDWHPIFESLNKIREEIKEYLPYKLISIETAEADDVISVVARKLDEPVLILSGDQDFIQLHKYPNIKQYAPIQKKYVRHDDPELFLRVKILSGDSGDGVPNILSDDDAIINPDKRQKPLRETRIKELLSISVEDFEEPLKKNYYRNEKLINLIDFIPNHLEEKILYELNTQTPSRNKMMSYFMKNKLRLLLEDLTDF